MDKNFVVRLVLFSILAMFGVYFLLGEPLTLETIRRLIPGVLMLAVGVGGAYYYATRLVHGDRHHDYSAIIERERRAAKIEETMA